MSFVSWTPADGSYNVGSNWSYGLVPGATDAAFFGASTFTDVAITAAATVGEWVFSPGDPAYSFTIDFGTPGSALAFAGSGITGGSAITIAVGLNARLEFDNSSSAGAASISVGDAAELLLAGFSTGADARIDNANLVVLADASTAGAATIQTEPGARTQFVGSSNGGSARFVNIGTGTVDFSGSTGPADNHVLTVGSIEGAGTFELGNNQLIVGLNGLSAEVTGLIEDGSGGGGSLVKVGRGSLKLSGADNTYSGGTTLKQGNLDLAALGAAGSGMITFAPASRATLTIDDAALSGHAFGNTIDHFGGHDFLDLAGLRFRPGATAVYHRATHHLTVHSGAVVDTLTLISPLRAQFETASDQHGGTDVYLLLT